MRQFFSIAEAVCALLAPHAEVVIHDLKSGKIAAIYNNFSKRKVGDDSSLDDLPEIIPDVFPPYFKTNWNGQRIKSTSATLKDQEGKPIGLLCINLDISKWEEMSQFIRLMIEPAIDQPAMLFKDDWRERVNVYVTDHLKKEGLSLQTLNKEQKQGLVRALYRVGAFESKNAANYIADVLQISRATIYNYLKTL
jgi:predicted transcriptional regulator YheO